MSSESQREPFLGYTDDDDGSAKSEARHYRNIQATGRNYLPYLMLVFATSFFWAGLFYLFHPSDNACHDNASTTSSSSSSSNSNSGGGGFTATIPIATSPEISSHHPSLDPSTAPATTDGSNTRLNITTNAHLTCGTTVPEARAHGCKYDILLNNWVPAPCYSQEFIDEYTDENNYSATTGWGGYADEAMTRPLSLQDMSEGPFYWTSLRDHVTHCAVLWKKQFATLFEYEARGVVDTVLASPGHTDHCAQFLMDVGARNWTGPTKTEMGFAGCWVRNTK